MQTDSLLQQWHHIIFERDMQALRQILAEDIQFYSPFFWKPKEGREAAFLILSNVIEVFQNFQYHREVIQENNWALEFSATVGDLSLKGIDLIEFNSESQISRFEVFIRPANALQAVGMAMAARLG